MWLTGPVAPRHVGSSQTRARTRVPCIGRQILNHCATREALTSVFLIPGQLKTIILAAGIEDANEKSLALRILNGKGVKAFFLGLNLVFARQKSLYS